MALKFDKTARVRDAESGRSLAILTGSSGHCQNRCLLAGPGKQLVTASFDQTARVQIVDPVDLPSCGVTHLPLLQSGVNINSFMLGPEFGSGSGLKGLCMVRLDAGYARCTSSPLLKIDARENKA